MTWPKSIAGSGRVSMSLPLCILMVLLHGCIAREKQSGLPDGILDFHLGGRIPDAVRGYLEHNKTNAGTASEDFGNGYKSIAIPHLSGNTPGSFCGFDAKYICIYVKNDIIEGICMTFETNENSLRNRLFAKIGQPKTSCTMNYVYENGLVDSRPQYKWSSNDMVLTVRGRSVSLYTKQFEQYFIDTHMTNPRKPFVKKFIKCNEQSGA